MSTAPCKNLETFPNPQPNRDYLIHIEIPEFTSLCPLTGQPDFATLLLDYIPDQKNVELKALKLYMWSYRQEGAFHEAITNKILDDLVAATSPRFIRLKANGGSAAASTRRSLLNTVKKAGHRSNRLNCLSSNRTIRLAVNPIFFLSGPFQQAVVFSDLHFVVFERGNCFFVR